MHSKVAIGYRDGDHAARASIVAEVVAAEVAVARAQAAAVRAFARAAAHAERVTRSKPARDRDTPTTHLPLGRPA
jgi:predicted outer membrane protein